MYITKKPHRKSRQGCQGCKRRKIKCDESRPECGFCRKRKLPCEYQPALSTAVSRSTSQTLITRDTSKVIGALTSHVRYGEIPRDLLGDAVPLGHQGTESMLMRHYSEITHHSLNFWQTASQETLTAWQVEIPRLAVEQDFLKNCLLALASLHLHSLRPNDAVAQRQSVIYSGLAFKGFRKAVARLTSANSEAVLATSVLLLFLSLGQQSKYSINNLWIVDWISLQKGVSSLLVVVGRQRVMTSRIAPIFKVGFNPYRKPPMLPKIFQDLYESVGEDDPDKPYLETLHSAMVLLGRLYARLWESGARTQELDLEITGWPASLGDEFVKLTKLRRPRALIILGHYLPFHDLVRQVYWTKGIASEQILAINEALPKEWRPWIELPRRALAPGDPVMTLSFLLGQLEYDLVSAEFLVAPECVKKQTEMPVRMLPIKNNQSIRSLHRTSIGNYRS